MTIGIELVTIYELLTGAFALAACAAAARSDGPATLAMISAGVMAGHLAQLSRPILEWSSAVTASALVASVVAVIASKVTPRHSAYSIGLVGTSALLVAMLLSGVDISDSLSARPLLLGRGLSAHIGALVRNEPDNRHQ